MRGMAAFAVVLFHYTYRYYEIYPQNEKIFFSFQIGAYGVQAFFIVSGFVIFMSLTRTKQPIDFIAHRFIRLYPTYWISMLLTFIVVSIFGLPGREVSFWEMLANLTMVQGQFGIASVDGVYWTLVCELKFYLLIFIIFLFNYEKKIEVLSLVYFFVLGLISFYGFSDNLIYKLFNAIFLFNYLSFFILGIMFYKVYIHNTNYLTYITLISAMAFGLLFDTLGGGYLPYMVIYSLFTLFSLHKLDWIATGSLVFLGSISYALYLVHQNIGYIILNFSYSKGINPLYGTLFALILSLVISSFITRLFEKNSMIYLKNLYNHKKEIILLYLDKNKYLSFLSSRKFEDNL